MGKDTGKGRYASPGGSHTWEYIITLISCIGSFCMGHVVGWTSPSTKEFSDPNSGISMTPEETSTLAASLGIGFMAATLLGIFVIDRIGRKKSMLAAIAPLMVSWGMILVGGNVMVLIAARALSGLSAGMVASASSIHMSEILSTKLRGSMMIIGYIAYYLGVLFMFAIAPYLGVRVTSAVCMIVTTIWMIGTWFVPESPYFLVMVGREDEAEAVLEKLRGRADVAEELDQIRATIRETCNEVPGDKIEGEKHGSFFRLFTVRGNLKALGFSMLLALMGDFNGFSVVMTYCHLILEAIGSGLDVYAASLTFGILQVISAGVAVCVIDRFGRRPLLFTSLALTIVFLGLIAAYFFLLEHTDVEVERYGIIPLCSIFGLVVALNVGVVSVPEVIKSEIYATDIRLVASCIVSVSESLVGTFSTKYYFLMATSWGFGHSIPFFGYAVITSVCTVILVRWLPETRGKTLLEIQRELNA